MSSERRLSRWAWATSFALALCLEGCVSSAGACSGELVSGNEECEPGCGLRVGRRVPGDGCDLGEEAALWCVRPAQVAADVSNCWVDEPSGTRFYTHSAATLHPPSTVRRCTAEEETIYLCLHP
jgi:hypothetical protein